MHRESMGGRARGEGEERVRDSERRLGPTSQPQPRASPSPSTYADGIKPASDSNGRDM
eukprot:CAMPEP_0183333194 /NCGR_PEP_ID=MMETSP0164_2-20130417/2151_1 /TAXON_ID=221442 /ORGANISM="Coccolithus pelagicus ssp braarudi, Strain PLY182g" /LENGTH=57 /DNA_ID=CAMNT_0025502063 /DNA_START=260 /DNA_END=430 /DNA_ORIENTATION=-